MNPVLMERVALVAPTSASRDLLVAIADAGTVELDVHPARSLAEPSGPAGSMLRTVGAAPEATLSAAPPDLEACRSEDRMDVVAGEAQVEAVAAAMGRTGTVCAITGWIPATERSPLATRIAPFGGAVVPLRRPPGAQPPTLLSEGKVGHQFDPLVRTYGTVPYADVNPSVIAGVAYVVMFGMMFADVGHGLVLLAAGLVARQGAWRPLARLRAVWLFIAGAGAASIVFGALYGEFFGPTGVFPVIWLSPLDQPVELLVAGVVAGAALLAGAYALGTVNRFREGGWRRALYAPSGVAGGAMFLGLAAIASGAYVGSGLLLASGIVVAALGLIAALLGLLASAGFSASGAMESTIELFDLVIRLGSNLVSFARLAAFGLTHAALGAVIWQATSALWSSGGLAVVGAAVVFLVGNAVAFGLEGLIAAIQALRLEYYELFSRIFDIEGRPFAPWHVPLDTHAPSESLE